jgi:hypothetical protein
LSLQRALEEQKKQNQQEVAQIAGLLGIPLSGQRRVEVPNRNSYVFVRLRSNTSEVIQAYNNQVAPAYDLPVIVERHGNKYIVAGVDSGRYENNWASQSPFLPRHGNTHTFDLEMGGGGDVVWVQSPQFVPSLVFPSGSVGGSNVIVHPYTIRNSDGTWRYVGNTGTSSLAPYRPTSPTGAIMALVYLNADTGNPQLLINSGSVFSNSITGSSHIVSYIPRITNPGRDIPLAAIRLITGTNVISWSNIYDVRQWLHTIPTGSAGGGGGPIDTGTLDARYLKLDTSNDPLYNQLLISGSIRISKNQMDGVSAPNNTPFYAESYLPEAPIADFEQFVLTGTTVNTPVLTIYRGNLGEGAPKFIQPAIWVGEDSTGGSFYDGILKGVIDGVTRVNTNPSATGTLLNYLWDTDKARPTGTIHTDWRVSGSSIAYLDVGGTFFSSGSALVRESRMSGRHWFTFGVFDTVSPTSAGGNPYAGTVDRNMTFVQWMQGCYIVTTNDGSNYWRIVLAADNGTVATTIKEINTSALAPNGWRKLTNTAFDVASITTSQNILYVSVAKVGTPGALYIAGPALEVLV